MVLIGSKLEQKTRDSRQVMYGARMWGEQHIGTCSKMSTRSIHPFVATTSCNMYWKDVKKKKKRKIKEKIKIKIKLKLRN